MQRYISFLQRYRMPCFQTVGLCRRGTSFTYAEEIDTLSKGRKSGTWSQKDDISETGFRQPRFAVRTIWAKTRGAPWWRCTITRWLAAHPWRYTDIIMTWRRTGEPRVLLTTAGYARRTKCPSSVAWQTRGRDGGVWVGEQTDGCGKGESGRSEDQINRGNLINRLYRRNRIYRKNQINPGKSEESG